jgi:recombination protein RecR
VCTDPRRDAALLCVVEEPATVLAMDRAGYRGRYLVLGGRLSPLDGIGPDDLRLDLLMERATGGTVREVVLATNPSIEGEATTYVQQLLVQDVR